MKIPPFSEFISSIDPNKMDFDLGLYMSPELKKGPTALNDDEFALVIRTSIAITKTYLAAYHQWLSEQLREENHLDL